MANSTMFEFHRIQPNRKLHCGDAAARYIFFRFYAIALSPQSHAFGKHIVSIELDIAAPPLNAPVVDAVMLQTSLRGIGALSPQLLIHD